jgi:hypothetical protein
MIDDYLSSVSLKSVTVNCEWCKKPITLHLTRRKRGFVLKDVKLSEKYQNGFYIFDRRNYVNKNKEESDDIYVVLNSVNVASVYSTRDKAQEAIDVLFPEGNVCRPHIKIFDFEEERAKKSCS